MAENSAAPIGPIPLPEPPSALTAEDREQDRARLHPSGASAPPAVEGALDTVVQLIHKHVGVRQRVNVDLTGVEPAARAILAAFNDPRNECEDCARMLRKLTLARLEIDQLRAVPQEAPNRENLRPFAEWADRNRSAVSHEAADELILLARKACDAYGPLSRPHGGRE